jgi:T5SS/PEP-CTERM-associated repeat protein
VDNDFIIGAHGTGSVLIANGGKVDGAGLTVIGQGGYDSNGTVTVTGSGSLWDQKGNVLVGGRPDGNGGSGALHVRAGGLVRAHHLKFFSNSTLDIDNGSRAVAGLQIVGGSAPPAAGGTLGDMVVGLNTSGRMEISGGGTVTSARGYTGFNAGSDAVTTVSGAGSRWNCSGSIWTGNAGTRRAGDHQRGRP